MSYMPNHSVHSTSWVTPPPRTAHGDHHIVRNALITVGASAVIIAGLAIAQDVHTSQTTEVRGGLATVTSYEVFAPGGSVYEQQVPAARG